MKQQIAFPLVLSITILLLLGGMLYAILAAPTQSSKKLAMTWAYSCRTNYAKRYPGTTNQNHQKVHSYTGN